MRCAKGWARRYTQTTIQIAECVLSPEHLRSADLARTEPGGYLQWVEYDPVSFKVVSPDPSLKQSANEKHVQIIRGPEGKATESVSFHRPKLRHLLRSLKNIVQVAFQPLFLSRACRISASQLHIIPSSTYNVRAIHAMSPLCRRRG